MGYNNLSESTLTPEERVAEKDRIVNRLMGIVCDLTDKEAAFINQMDGSDFCSIKQLFYLRDISDKY